MIELVDIEKYYSPDRPVIRKLSMTIREGEFLTFLGPSGCGKTTLLRIIAGLERPTRGDVFLAGSRITHLPPYRRDVNLVFQQYALFPHMTVRENIEFGLRMKKIAAAERTRRIEEVMRLTQIEELRDRYPHQLSGGQQQRVAIARAIVNEPKVLLLDEPLSALDFQLRKELRAELKQLQHRLGMTFVYVTHDQEEAMAMSDRIAVMNDGVVEQIGTPDDIYHRPGSLFVATFVGESNIIRAGGRCRAVRPEKVRLFPGETLNGSARCRGTIEDVAFMGSLYRIRICAQPEGSRLTVYQYGDEGRKWRIGAAVDVEWSPDDEVELNA